MQLYLCMVFDIYHTLIKCFVEILMMHWLLDTTTEVVQTSLNNLCIY